MQPHFSQPARARALTRTACSWRHHIVYHTACMLTSSTAQKSRTCRARQASDCHIQHTAAKHTAADPLHLAEKAHARCEQGSELTVCSNAFIGAVCHAMRCCAVRCSAVQSCRWQLAGTQYAFWWHAGLFRARGCRASGQGSRRVAKAAVAARRSAVGAYLARCRG